MNKYVIGILIFTGLLLGTLVAIQFRSDFTVSGNFLADEVIARDSLFEEFLEEQTYLQSRIVSLRQQIADAQTQINENSEESDLEMLEELKKKVGLTEISGEALEITLEDGPLAFREGATASDKDLVQASDVRDVINILNASNADAIAINNQRIIATSAITAVGATILVNNSHVTPPFTITAVGDTEIMLQRLLNESLLPSIFERSSKGNIVFRIAVKSKASIPIYNGNLKTDNLNLVE